MLFAGFLCPVRSSFALIGRTLGALGHIQEEMERPMVERIKETIRAFSAQGCGLILTTGGTGIAARDVTPEAIRAIMRVELPGFGEAMRMESLKITPNAILSRSLAAVVDQSLVIALPGKPSGAVECLGFVAGAIPHAVALAQRVPTSC